MRILTGALRGRVIAFRPEADLRPTADKVRKAVFDALQGRARGREALDLYAGTGALGFEALSGGAAGCVFVERNPGRSARIAENLKRLGLSAKADVLTAEASAALKKLEADAWRFGLVFVDPPYERGLAKAALEQLGNSSSLLEADALVVAECYKKEELPERPGRLKAVKRALHGDTQTVFYLSNI